MTTLTSGAEILIAERRSGLLRRALVSSLAPSALVVGKFLSRFLFAWIQIALLLSVGIFLFHIEFGSHPWALFAVLTCFALCATGLGVLFATLFEHPDKASGVGILVTLAMASLGGCWWPLEIVSGAMQKIAWFLPTGWGFDALNRVMALDSGLGPLHAHLTYLLGVAAVTVPLAAWRLSRAR
jgi:ABC-type multidrug transport system permease subunit